MLTVTEIAKLPIGQRTPRKAANDALLVDGFRGYVALVQVAGRAALRALGRKGLQTGRLCSTIAGEAEAFTGSLRWRSGGYPASAIRQSGGSALV